MLSAFFNHARTPLQRAGIIVCILACLLFCLSIYDISSSYDGLKPCVADSNGLRDLTPAEIRQAVRQSLTVGELSPCIDGNTWNDIWHDYANQGVSFVVIGLLCLGLFLRFSIFHQIYHWVTVGKWLSRFEDMTPMLPKKSDQEAPEIAKPTSEKVPLILSPKGVLGITLAVALFYGYVWDTVRGIPALSQSFGHVLGFISSAVALQWLGGVMLGSIIWFIKSKPQRKGYPALVAHSTLPFSALLVYLITGLI